MTEYYAEEFAREPETISEVIAFLMHSEVTRGIAFGGLGAMLAIPLGLVHWGLDRFPDEVLPPQFIAPIVAMVGLVGGASMAIWPFMGVSHSVQVAMQAITLYGVAHGVRNYRGGKL